MDLGKSCITEKCDGFWKLWQVSDLFYFKSKQMGCPSCSSDREGSVCSNSGRSLHAGYYADLYRCGMFPSGASSAASDCSSSLSRPRQSSDLFGLTSDIHNDLFASTRQVPRTSCPGHFPGDSKKLQQEIQKQQVQRHAKSFQNRRVSANVECGPLVATTRVARTNSSRLEMIDMNKVEDGSDTLGCSFQPPRHSKALSGRSDFHGRERGHSMDFERNRDFVRMSGLVPSAGHRDYSDLYRGGMSHYISPVSSSVPRASSNFGLRSPPFSSSEDKTTRRSFAESHMESVAVGPAMKPRRSLQHPPPNVPGSGWQKPTRVCISPSGPPRKSMSQSPCWPAVIEEGEQGDWQPMSLGDIKDLLRA